MHIYCSLTSVREACFGGARCDKVSSCALQRLLQQGYRRSVFLIFLLFLFLLPSWLLQPLLLPFFFLLYFLFVYYYLHQEEYFTYSVVCRLNFSSRPLLFTDLRRRELFFVIVDYDNVMRTLHEGRCLHSIPRPTL